MSARILTIDIETSPSLADVWGLWNQNVGLSQLRDASKVICWAAKWRGQAKVHFASDHHDGHETMVQKAWDLLDRADIVVHYNGTKFDIPHLQREFATLGLLPPSPFKQVDLLKAVKKQFRFVSNKLQHVSTELGLEGKFSHTGHELWQQCMAGDPAAWREMRKYNVQDVRLTEQLYERLLPWIPGHPHMGLYSGERDACQNCGGTEGEWRGYAYTQLGRYRRWRCVCGRWNRVARRDEGVDMRGVA